MKTKLDKQNHLDRLALRFKRADNFSDYTRLRLLRRLSRYALKWNITDNIGVL